MLPRPATRHDRTTTTTRTTHLAPWWRCFRAKKKSIFAQKTTYLNDSNTAARAGGKLNREQRQECESESVADVVVLGGGNTCLARRSSQRATVAM